MIEKANKIGKRKVKANHIPDPEEELCTKKIVDSIKLLQANEYLKMKFSEKIPIVNGLKDEFFEIKCKHDNIYLYGYYTKESREISQVRWMLEEKRKVILEK